jgi:hypothetical protein
MKPLVMEYQSIWQKHLDKFTEPTAHENPIN